MRTHRAVFLLLVGFVFSSVAFSGAENLQSEMIQVPKTNQNEKALTQDYESVINEYTKYLSGVSKEVKEEEMRHLGEMSKIDKEIAKLRHKRVLLNSKLSEAAKDHQNTKMIFEQKLNSLSKFKKYSALGGQRNYKKKKEAASKIPSGQ